MVFLIGEGDDEISLDFLFENSSKNILTSLLEVVFLKGGSLFINDYFIFL